MTTKRRSAGLSRRSVLIGAGVALAGCRKPAAEAEVGFAPDAALGVKALARADVPLAPVVVDVHCHTFCASDLPIYGFLMKVGRGMLEEKKLSAAVIDGLLGFARPFFASLQTITQGLGPRDELQAMLGGATERTDWDKAFDSAVVHAYDKSLGLKTLAPPAPATAEQAERAIERQLAKQPRTLPLKRWADTEAIDRGAVPLLPDHKRAPISERERARSVYVMLKDVFGFIASGAQSRVSEAAQLANLYEDVALFTPSLVDFDRWVGELQGDTRPPPTHQVEQVRHFERLCRISIARRLPGIGPGRAGRAILHPIVAFDPRREAEENPGPYAHYSQDRESVRYVATPLGAPATGPWIERLAPVSRLKGKGSFELLRYAIEQSGFIGVKLYPPVGFRPSGNLEAASSAQRPLMARIDGALHRLYSYCEQLQVPILVHCGSANAFDPAFQLYSHPAEWRKVLAQYKGLRLCLGHFGHAEGVTNADDPASIAKGWASAAVGLMSDYPNLYADLANSELHAVGENAAFNDSFGKVLAALAAADQGALRKRLLYGTDWFMNNLVGNVDRYLGYIRRAVSTTLGESAINPFLGWNALRFLGLIDDDDRPIAAGKSLNRDRLVAFYEGQNQPEWLRGD